MMKFIKFFILQIKGMRKEQVIVKHGSGSTGVLSVENVPSLIEEKYNWILRFLHNLKSSTVRMKLTYSQSKKYNTISAISVPHHIETNMGRWIHVTAVQNEEVYDPSDLNGKKIPMTKEHSVYIYNPSLDKVVDLSKISLDQLISQTKKPVLMRIHSLCRFGDSFGSLMCDCGPQLVAAKSAIISNGSGMIIYLEQEGRNAGLVAKAAAYRLDAVEKIPTDKTFSKLGLDRSDLRDYDVVLDVFSVFKIKKAELMTNNPKKFSLLTSKGIEIIQRAISIPATEHNLGYLITKKNQMGHERLTPEKKSGNETHIKIANILNEIPQVINEKNMSIFQKIIDEEKEKTINRNLVYSKLDALLSSEYSNEKCI